MEQTAPPQTPKQKWENYWYYYKFHTIVSVFIIAVLTIGIVQMVTQVKPDYRIILCTSDYGAHDTEKMREVLPVYGFDLNGDGTAVVSVEDCSFNQETMDANAIMANQTKVLAEIQMDGIFIYICDKEQFGWLNREGLFEPLGQDKQDTSPENTGWCWKDSEFKAEHFPDAPDELYFCLRGLEGTTLEGNQKAMERYERDRALLENIMNNTVAG